MERVRCSRRPPQAGRWLSVLLCLGAWAAAGPAVRAADAPTLTITAPSAFLRSAPSAQAPATYSVFEGQVYVILGRTADNTWLFIDYPRAKKGTWILATLGKLTGSLADVPIVTGGTPGAAATPAPPGPGTARPTAAPPTASPASTAPVELCLLLFEDVNGNGLPGEAEGVISGGQLNILNPDTGAVLWSYTTIAADSGRHCFAGVPAGRYTLTAAAPTGYNPTTPTSIELTAQPGERYALTFGAQPGASARADAGQPSGPPAWLGPLGVAVLGLAGLLAAFRLLRRR